MVKEKFNKAQEIVKEISHLTDQIDKLDGTKMRRIEFIFGAGYNDNVVIRDDTLNKETCEHYLLKLKVLRMNLEEQFKLL